MHINLLSCEAQRPDKRKIALCLTEYAKGMSSSLANELTEMLLAGDVVEIEIDSKNSGSALGTLRKLKVDYEIDE